jgi:hypothetical protein
MRLVLWGDRAVEFDADTVRAMGEKESVIGIFVGTLPKTAHGKHYNFHHFFTLACFQCHTFPVSLCVCHNGHSFATYLLIVHLLWCYMLLKLT